MKNLETFLKQLDELELNPDEYCIVSSGSLAVRNIRDCSDLDILVTKELFHELEKRFPENKRTLENIGDVISYKNIDFFFFFKEHEKYTGGQRIKNADIIDGKRFQNLETIKFFKKDQAREKDLKDLELIADYEYKILKK